MKEPVIKQSKEKNLKDCKVIQGSEIVSKHRMVVLDMCKSKEHKRKVRKVGRFKIWKVKMGQTRTKFRDVVKMANVNRSKEGEVEEIWQELKETLRKASDQILGRGIGNIVNIIKDNEGKMLFDEDKTSLRWESI